MKLTASKSRLALIAGLLLAAALTGCKGGKTEAPDATTSVEAPVAETGKVKFDETALKLADLTVEPVRSQSLSPKLSVSGTVEPNLGGVMKVTPRVAGKITTVNVNVGDNIRAGQVLAVLTSTELAEAQAEYDHTNHLHSIATKNLDRQRKLAKLGAFGAPKLEESRTRTVTAEGEVDTVRNELNAAKNEVAEARSEAAAEEAEVASAEADAASAQSSIVSAQSAVIEAEGQVKSQQAALGQAQTAARVSQSRFNRADVLLKDQLVSKQDWEQAQADLQRAQADVEAARANVGQAQAKVAQEQARVEATRAALKAAQAKIQAERGRAQQAAAKIESAQARQAQVEAKLAAAGKRREIAAQELGREEKVFRGGFMTSKEILEAESALTEAMHDREAAIIKVQLLGGTPGGGNYVNVTAPLAGRVTERLVTLGEMVAPEKPLFTVINLNSVWVQLNVYQQDVATVRVGQSVSVTSDTSPGRTFVGAVSYIGDLLDEKSRTVKVRCVIQNQGGLLKPASFVRGTLAASASVPRVVVPEGAVQEVNGKKVVYMPTAQPSEFEARPIEVGQTSDGVVEIRAGLREGERIVTKNAFMVKAQAMKAELAEE